MKLKSYFLLSIVVGMTFACSSDENVPEVEVFTPDATLSLAAVADGKSLTKAGEGEGENIDQEDAINSLHVMVFYADGNLQIDKVVAINRVEDLDVQSGAVKILVLANAGTREKQFGTLKEALVYQRYNPQNQKSRFQKRKIKKNGKRFVDSLYSLIDLKTI